MTVASSVGSFVTMEGSSFEPSYANWYSDEGIVLCGYTTEKDPRPTLELLHNLLREAYQ